MLFASTTFLFLFLPAVLIIYYGLLFKSRTLKNICLTLFSLLFYAWGEPSFVLIMILSIVMNWLIGLFVENCRKNGKQSKGKVAIAIAVALNLSVLFVFKYLSFSAYSLNRLLGLSLRVPQISLPIGISFFTFQAMSYVIDVYRGRGKGQKNILNVALYIALFPQLIAGPIVRYETVAHEIEHRKETLDDFLAGLVRFVTGLAKKVLIANTMAIFADQAFAAQELTVAESWLGALCYSFQIFFDFSGYSDMAIGLGKMFGFHFLENFNYPYISRSVTEFWRRWHMSLGSWFRDYVYIPLGGSRVKTPRLIMNLFVVWLLTGVWHGANWTFLLWGLLYFILLTAEKLTGFDKRPGGKLIGTGRWLYTMIFVVLGWVLFRADSVSAAFLYIKTMFGFSGTGFISPVFFGILKSCGLYLLVAAVLSTPIAPTVGSKIREKYMPLQIFYRLVLALLFICSVASIVSSAHNPFIYFNF